MPTGLELIMRHRISPASGFTLTELAIVLVIVALLLGGMMTSLGTQRDIANARETENRLNDIRDALFGFTMANDRLPCPAAPPPAGGTESPPSTGVCNNALNGFVPAGQLGIGPADANGYSLDAWNNPYRYAIFPGAIDGRDNPFTVPGRIKTIGMAKIAAASHLLFVCGSATGIASSDCGTAPQITDRAVAIIYSTGKNGIDETRAGADDIVFVSAPSVTADDQAIWISSNIVFSRMISAGRLP